MTSEKELLDIILSQEKRIATLEAVLADLIPDYFQQDEYVTRMLIDLKVELLTHNRKSPYSRLKHLEEQFKGLVNYFNVKLDGKPVSDKRYNEYA